MRAAVIQSSYIPWKGYFDLIGSVDTFVFYDDVQFTSRDWRTRNRIKTHHGVQWLSIPAGPSINRLICEVSLESSVWQRKHWASISQAYAKAPYFKTYAPLIRDIYLSRSWSSLSEFNQYFTRLIATDILKLKTVFLDSRSFQLQGKRQERLIDLLQQIGATHYLSGPSAKSYIDPALFQEAGIKVTFHDYSHYPEYPQLHRSFEHGVSVLDLIFNVGADANRYIWGHRSVCQDTREAVAV
jgi:hypothetical protein